MLRISVPRGSTLVEVDRLAAAPREADLPVHDPAGLGRQQAQDRVGGDALAAAGLADQPDRLARLDVDGDAVDGPDDAVAGEEVGLEIVDLEQAAGIRRCAGSTGRESVIATPSSTGRSRRADRRRGS